jgi:hypothetical protein
MFPCVVELSRTSSVLKKHGPIEANGHPACGDDDEVIHAEEARSH